MGGLYIEGISLEGFMRPQLLPLFTSQQNSSVPPCAPAMMCSLATNLQMWCHMTMGWNPYNFRPQIPFSPYKVFISVVSVYSVRKLTNSYTDSEWKGNKSQVKGFLFFYSNFDLMFRGILTSWSIKLSSGYSEKANRHSTWQDQHKVLKLTSFLWMVFLIHPSDIWLLVHVLDSDLCG